MSTLSDWAALDEALDRALDLEGAEREAFLATLDAATRDALKPLLRDALSENDLLDHPEVSLGSLLEDEGCSNSMHITNGVRIGPYEIESLVGEGGMGRVFRAYRVDGAFDRTVALKVVRATLLLAGSDVAARLRRERAMLATLDHPGIARLLDGGETDDGVPYLVTEFIDGAEITTWADEREIDVEARVRLMIGVARAVDHAHRRFVVHRDLKPSNVLVTERDGVARPVVLDFGIAKLLEDAPDEGTHGFPLTRTGLRLLTPAYAAPEMFEPMATVTTAADVYGLGAMLYELLTGRRPHDDTASTGPPTTEATRPSRVVTLPTDTVTSFDPAQRARVLRGDLDTICLKALHPDPARRYASASALAEDLTRYLDGRPVEARPDSLAYVAGRFARRHRTAVAAVVVAVLSLVGGLGAALVALGNEREARAEAEAAVSRANEASDLLAGLFAMADPDYAEGRDVTVREAVEYGVRQVVNVESASLRAKILSILGRMYIDLGEPVMADSLLQAALDFYGEGAVGDEVTQVRLNLALTRDALADPERVLQLSQQVYRDHHNDREPGIALAALRSMKRAYSRLGRHEEAVAVAEEAQTLLGSEATAEQHIAVSKALGMALFNAGRVAESIPPLEEALQRSIEAFGRASGATSSAMTALGRARGYHGDTEEAEDLLREAIAFHAERYGANRVGYPLAYLGEIKLRAGQFRQAAAALDSAITMAGPIIGRDHPDIGGWLTLRAEACNGYGAYGEAEQAARRALDIAEAEKRALAQLEVALRGQGREPEAHPARIFRNER